jgi:2-(1,2-epoxy-1,2-dihydrophenyl)acetyl-CoA isomerase
MPALEGSAHASVGNADPPPPILERPRPAPELSIVVPTFNERENIPRLIDTLRAALAGVAWELIVVDDDSPDGTSETAKQIAAADARIRCIRRVGRRGLAGACLEGFLASQAAFVAVMDGDLQHDEGLLLPMLALLRRDAADMVVATRYATGGSAAALSSQRAWGSRLANRLAHRVLKLELSDPMSGFFMLRRELVERTAPKLSTQGFKILLDIAVSAGDRLRVTELPFTFRQRLHGQSKLDAGVALEYLFRKARIANGEWRVARKRDSLLFAIRYLPLPGSSMDENPILVERRDGYSVVTLNRPQRLNACNEAMLGALRDALAAAENDPACRALLLTGAGRGFCAGQDLGDRLSQAGETPVLGGVLEAYYNPLVRKLRALPFPVVAAVNGVAAGAGANIALACDIVLAARSASFVQAFAKVGLVPDAGGTWFLPRLVGSARARGLALTAEPLPAETAAAWGLIWKAVDDAALMPEAEKLCAAFAAAATIGLALTKRALDESWDNDLETQLELERELQRQASLTPDYAEGLRAFMEKRKPLFSGRINRAKPTA